MNDTNKSAGPESVSGGMSLENFDHAGQAASGNGRGEEGERGFAPVDHADPTASDGMANLDTILGISVSLSVELGRVWMTINELLHLTHGSVVDLDRLAGSPMDILANGTLIAHGEVVVVKERFGVRLTDVVSPAERIKGLK